MEKKLDYQHQRAGFPFILVAFESFNMPPLPKSTCFEVTCNSSSSSLNLYCFALLPLQLLPILLPCNTF